MADGSLTTSLRLVLPSQDLTEDMGFFTRRLGFRLDQIFPADDPAVAVMSGHRMTIRLDRDHDGPAGVLHVLAPDPAAVAGGETSLTAPNGTRIEILPDHEPLEVPPTAHQFVVRRLQDQAPWVIGRAGMHYRDLIPDRLGGSIIASHIRIPDGGPVPDMVHYHTVGFQLIFCYRGWVDLVYEDYGPPFRLYAGDCVIQPPEIRHRVLVASDNVEVVEIGVPAEHITTIDHDMELPNGPPDPDRLFHGQQFVHHRAGAAVWAPWRLPGFEHRDTGIAVGTGGVAGVQIARATGPVDIAWRHDCDILFGFVMEGAVDLSADGQATRRLTPGDAWVIPPGMAVQLSEASADFELLEVSLPGTFETELIA
ncbi:MAG: cupin domain-containing protein [Pseudomonadota bacterium]